MRTCSRCSTARLSVPPRARRSLYSPSTPSRCHLHDRLAPHSSCSARSLSLPHVQRWAPSPAHLPSPSPPIHPCPLSLSLVLTQPRLRPRPRLGRRSHPHHVRAVRLGALLHCARPHRDRDRQLVRRNALRRSLRRRGRLHADELPASCTHGRFVVTAFMGIYNVAVDSILLSFAVDLERAKRAGDRLRSTGSAKVFSN